MRLKDLEMENWMSYAGLHRYSFQPGLTMVYGVNKDRPTEGSNASGKSSLLLAVYYALRGKLPMKSKQAGLIHDGAKQAVLHLWLDSPEESLEIYRAIGGRGSEFWWKAGDGKVVEGDKVATQKELDAYLGLSGDLFDVTCFLSPNADFKPLRHQTGGKTMEMMSAFVDTTPWEPGAEQALKEINHFTALRDRYLGESATYRRLQERDLQLLGEFNTKLLEERRLLRERSSRREEEAQQIERQILELQMQLREKPEGNVNELQAALAVIRTEVDEMHKAQGRLSAIIQRNSLGAGAWCPTCHQIVSTDHDHLMQQEKAQAQQELKTYNDRFGELAREQAALQQRYDLLRGWTTKEMGIKAKIENLKTQAFAHREKMENNQVALIERDIEGLKTRIQEYQEETQEKDLEVSRLNQHIPILQKLREGFLKGIGNMLLGRIRDHVAHYSDLYTGYLCSEGIRVEHISETTSGKETWDLQVYKHEQPRSLPSGGEGLLVDLAQSLAIREVLIAQNECKLDFLMLDDYFGQLDTAHCVKVAELLLELGGDRISNILVATPKESGIAGNHDITVTKQGGKSTIGEN